MSNDSTLPRKSCAPDARGPLAAVRVLLLVLLVVAVAVDVLRGGQARRIGLSEAG